MESECVAPPYTLSCLLQVLGNPFTDVLQNIREASSPLVLFTVLLEGVGIQSEQFYLAIDFKDTARPKKGSFHTAQDCTLTK